ncbi:MAG: LLM class flavin-dependent oxidoreductase [Candidatus Hodarchaeota archaeon]
MIDFGIQIEPQFGFDYPATLQIVQTTENIGFSNIWLSDHFFLDTESTNKISYDIWTIMTAIAVQTQHLRIGSMVLCNSYRHPAVAAKMVATLDQISNGRFEFGFGAGWKQIEYNAYGFPFPSAKIRIEQLAEAIQVMKALWKEDKANFQGKYYELIEAISFPKPLQQPHPPLWIGTMAVKPKMLQLIAHYADGANLAWAYTPEQVKDTYSRIDNYAEKFGRKTPIRRSLGLWAGIYRSENEFEQAIQETAKRRGMPLEGYRHRLEGALHGPPEFWLKRIAEYEEAGIEKLILMFPYQKELESLDLLAETVLPHL